MPGCHVYEWTNLTAVETGAVRRTLVGGDGADLKRVEIPAGITAEKHEHPHEQFILVVEGRGRLTTVEGTTGFASGTVFRLEAHTWHSAVFETDTVLVEVNLKPR